MTDDLRAAAERVRRTETGDDVLAVYAHVQQDWRVIDAAMRGDRQAVIEAYLAEHPADDGEAVDGAWLSANGFYRPMQAAASRWYTSRASVPQGDGTTFPVVSIEFPQRHRPDEVLMWSMCVYAHRRDFNQCPTRGYVRRLLAALAPTPVAT